MSDLSDIWARWEKATPGPWNSGDQAPRPSGRHQRARFGFQYMVDGTMDENDAYAIANAPEDIARLRAEVERLRAEQALDLKDRDHFRAMARRYMDERDELRAKLARVEALLPDNTHDIPDEGWLRIRRIRAALKGTE